MTSAMLQKINAEKPRIYFVLSVLLMISPAGIFFIIASPISPILQAHQSMPDILFSPKGTAPLIARKKFFREVPP